MITTSTYEARALGVFSGMGLMKSAQLAPDAILLPANFDAYRESSRLFKAAVASIAPKIEDRGIDEIYIDLTDIPEETKTLARRIKQAAFDATGLTCSIGISPNKLLSKICSDLEKPNGITILSMEDIPARIWPLAAKKINGIGPKASERLAHYGINTVGDLAATSVEFLVTKFGRVTGTWLARVAQGIDDRQLVTETEPKSISRESTFERDLHARQDRAELIGIKLRYADFHSVTRDLTLPVSVSDGAEIRKAAGECLKRVPLTQRIRLLGVRASGLSPLTQSSVDLHGIQAELPL